MFNFCNHSHPFHTRLCSIFTSFGLSQVVSEPIHHCSNGLDSLIDLLAISSPSLLQSCETISPLSNSDHLGLLVSSHYFTVETLMIFAEL